MKMYKEYQGLAVHYSKIDKVFRRMCIQAVDEYQFTPNEIVVLMFLANNPGIDSASDIAHFKNISKGLVARSVESLCEKGFLCTSKDPNDRRLIHLHLTEESGEVMKRLHSCLREFVVELQDGVSAEDLSAMKRATAVMDENLENMMKGMK